MQVTVRKWGNSAAIRLPIYILEAVHLKIDQPIDIFEEDGRLIIQPIKTTELSLDSLVNGITDANRHEEIDFDLIRGKEIW